MNRSCNLRCRWCYAAGTNYLESETMDFLLACELLDFVAALEIKEVALLGGEPTCYDGLTELVRYCRRIGINCQLITNGIKLSDAEFVSRIAEAGVSCVDISLKGFSAENYIAETGSDRYSQVMCAIKNVKSLGLPFSVSMVLSRNNIKGFIDGVRDAASSGANNFAFSFCHDFSALDAGDTNTEYSIQQNVLDVAAGFVNSYEELREATDDCFVLHQTFPFCIWEPNFIELLRSRSQIFSSCQIFRRDGLIFDTEGRLIPCNFMHQVKLGRFKEDFSSLEEFASFWNSETIKQYYKAITTGSVPDEACLNNCPSWKLCGGGCLSNWYNYSFDKLQRAKAVREES